MRKWNPKLWQHKFLRMINEREELNAYDCKFFFSNPVIVQGSDNRNAEDETRRLEN